MLVTPGFQRRSLLAVDSCERGRRSRCVATWSDRDGQGERAQDGREVASSAPRVIAGHIAHISEVLEESGFSDSCPVSPITIEIGNASEQVRLACRRFFYSWRTALATKLNERGMDLARSRRLADLVVYATEGALIVCRAERGLDALRLVSEEMGVLCESASGQRV